MAFMEADDMIWRAALVVAFVLANVGCWATGSAETIRQQPGRGGLVQYTPERDGWFGFSKGRDKALAKARGEAAKNCDPAEFEELESGKVTVGRETIEGNTQGGKSEWITPAASTSSSYATVQGRQEYRLRYICKGAPAGYEPPPMSLDAINETAPSKPASININTK
jgi:hypothetical protein